MLVGQMNRRLEKLALENNYYSFGQTIAQEQLVEIANGSMAQIEIINISEPTEEDSSLRIDISFQTTQIPKDKNGFRFRAREALSIIVDQEFPFSIPSIDFKHKRFIGHPHVQWGSHICLYQSSEIEWVSSDGIIGFIDRLNQWFRAAAINKLDPIEEPLHPPVVYTNSTMRFVPITDTPIVTAGDGAWVGSVKLSQRNKYCYDITEWLDKTEQIDRGTYRALAILSDSPFPMEYPDTVYSLITTLTNTGLTFVDLYLEIASIAFEFEDDQDVYVVIGSPMRRKREDETLRQHLAVWRISSTIIGELKKSFLNRVIEEKRAEDVDEFIRWAATAKTEWCRILENRDEIVVRRDKNTLIRETTNKRVLLLGCGALGSFIAEYLVRAGVESINLIDNGIVSPGILVRQQFKSSSVGFSKASALSVHLNQLGSQTNVSYEYKKIKSDFLREINLNEYDIIINATASRSVDLALEFGMKTHSIDIPLLSCSISSESECGMITTRMPEFLGGPYAISRSSKIAEFKRNSMSVFGNLFWPDKNKIKLFQPEPGCSDPTFIASAADIAYFSSALLNIGFSRLSELSNDSSSIDFISKINPTINTLSELKSSHILENTVQNIDKIHNYTIYSSNGMRSTLHSEIARNKRIGNHLNETGGLLFGEIDDSLQTIWIDDASGPPPDSLKSETLFECGVEGTKELCEFYKSRSKGSSSFIGIWHTHPSSAPEPSEIDLAAMVNILYQQTHRPRHIVMLIIGYAATAPKYSYYLFHRKNFEIIGKNDNSK